MNGFKLKGIFFAAAALAFVLPWAKATTSIPTILLFVLILWSQYRTMWTNQAKWKLSLWLGIFFILDLVKVIAQSDPAAHPSPTLSLDILLLLYPLFILSNPSPQELKRWSCLALLVSSLLLQAVALVYAGYHFLITRQSEYFYHEALVGFTNIHPTYLSMILNFTIWIGYDIYKKSNPASKYYQAFIAFILFEIFFIFLLNSRLGLIIAILNGLFLLYKTGPHIGLNIKLPFFVLIGCMMVLVFNNLPQNALKHRYKSIIDLNIDSLRHYEPRMNITVAAAMAIADKPVSGHALGSNVEVLVGYYKKIGFQWGVEARFNAHNQFLEYGIEWGIPGIILFVCLLIYSFYLGYQSRDSLWMALIVIVTCYSLTESIFKTQTGITFYAFFQSVMLAAVLNLHKTSNRNRSKN